ncbi:MAG: peptidylprolyl isomerase [Planctomycetes bacterium]|nr:peptidylprolyl isomerase [Planctomycetota bacterium]
MSLPETSRSEADSRSKGAGMVVWAWKHQIGWLVAAGVVLTVAIVFRSAEGDQTASAKAPSKTRTTSKRAEQKLPRVERPQHDVMAIVNGQDISRKVLIDACVRRHGEKVLESLVNKRLILNHCEKRGIAVTQEEIGAEIDRMAKRFKLGREQWLEMLKNERDITPQEYARDIVWPTLALRKLAAADLQPSATDIEKAIEREFGAAVRARLIAIGNADLARQLHAQLTAQPDNFARLAIEHSIDINSASVGGLIQPIRRHVGDARIEAEAFRLQPGQISSIISVGGQHVILKCEEHIPPRQFNRAAVEQQIVEKIKDEKLREVSHTLFAQLQSTATIQNVYNNLQLRETMPGVVATVNGDRVMMKELGQECLLRHGEEVLETEISHLLLEQELKNAGITVTDAELQAEVQHAAELAGILDQKGKVDLEQWFEAIAKEQGVTRAQYLRDSVWPSAALKKLTAKDVQVTDEDMQKGFEANYGERVRCRAIVLGEMRRAQEVWDKARRNQSVEYFGDLAAEYSIEPTSKALRGEVPPIGRYSGQPRLEEVAYALQPGQLSGIVQTGDKFIILRCEGRTEQIDLHQSDVREILNRDIYEKKMRLAMNEKFEQIREHSRVDNYLAGTSRVPSKRKEAGRAAIRQDTAVRPTAGQQ